MNRMIFLLLVFPLNNDEQNNSFIKHLSSISCVYYLSISICCFNKKFYFFNMPFYLYYIKYGDIQIESMKFKYGNYDSSRNLNFN